MANPGQDGDIENDPTQNPEHEIAQVVEQRQAEVEEIQAIEEEGGFVALTDISAEPSVLDAEGVVGMAVGGVRDGDEVQVQRKREGEQDLEAQWRPPVI
jgi:aquaporin related protein